MSLQRKPRHGVEQWVNPQNGLTVIQLHYSADPRKREPEWKATNAKNMHPRAWRREYEIDWSAPAGEPVVPEYQDDLHTQDFTWDPSLRLLRFWDFGYVSPVCLFAQYTWYGQLRIRSELCPFNTPLNQLMDGVAAITAQLAGKDIFAPDTYDVGGKEPEAAFDAGDPAAKNQTDLGSSAEELGKYGLTLHTTRPGTELSYAGLRARFLRQVMEPSRGPVPAVIIHPECVSLRAALKGAFHLDPLPPYKPVKCHPHKDLVDALRYGEDNIRQLVKSTDGKWRQMATGDQQGLRSIGGGIENDSWQAQQAEKWRQIVEGM